MSDYRYRCVLLTLSLVAVVLSGCKTNQIRPEIPVTPQINVDPTDVLPDSGPEVQSSELSSLSKVYFDYDSTVLRADAIEALKRNANWLNQTPGIRVMIEGHCDERGTQEYNLVLGERRAVVVREQLIRLGVAPERLLTISYGKERPAVKGNSESDWAKNRRCEFSRAGA